MGRVLDFPSQQSRELAHLARELGQLLAGKGADQALIDFATRELTQRYGEIRQGAQPAFSVTLPEGISAAQQRALEADINAGLAAVHRHHHRLLLELLAQLLLTQMRLFQQQRD